MIIFPVIYFLALSQNYSRIIYSFILAAYLILNVIILTNQIVISDLSKKTYNFLMNENIIDETHPGYFGQHSLSKFTKFYDDNLNKIDQDKIFSKSKKYIIVDKVTNNNDIIFKYSSNRIFKNKEIFVIRNY